MNVRKKDEKTLYKKLKRLLAGLFIDIELVQYLSARKLYKLMWRVIKLHDKYDYSKKEVKELAKVIVNSDFENVDFKDATVIADFVAFAIAINIIEKIEYTECHESTYVNRFYSDFPLTLE
ncbi:hypothetical protein [Mycoplasma todarodis]|uniref:Uncharacterized protein n=1 Tax=Mycoplasma todarodis TaxID=1937191 RepID=A0A4R0XNG9_9MOLU|nr:hypothetical protein [Mycoplasma todarodis]TCG11032.1 hypothetical protein C4B25_02455 [Mycoplasma todarodis]